MRFSLQCGSVAAGSFSYLVGSAPTAAAKAGGEEAPPGLLPMRAHDGRARHGRAVTLWAICGEPATVRALLESFKLSTCCDSCDWTHSGAGDMARVSELALRPPCRRFRYKHFLFEFRNRITGLNCFESVTFQHLRSAVSSPAEAAGSACERHRRPHWLSFRFPPRPSSCPVAPPGFSASQTTTDIGPSSQLPQRAQQSALDVCGICMDTVRGWGLPPAHQSSRQKHEQAPAPDQWHD